MPFKDFESIMRRFSGVCRWLVAFSGGLDSTVLLHRLIQLKLMWNKGPEIVAVHVNHGLQSEAAQWLNHCEVTAQQWGVEFISHTITENPNSKDSIEAWARQHRYQYFLSIMQPDDLLITGHHQNDQVETLLLQSLRGAGPYGLAGMPLVKTFGENQLLRPLLNESRQSLQAYAQEHQLLWIEDPSNEDRHIDRNYLRHQVLPMMQQRWPQMDKTVARSARLLADSLELLDDLAAMDLSHVLAAMPNCLSIAELQTLSQKRQQHVIRFYLRQRALPLPSEDQLRQLFDAVIAAAQDSQPLLMWCHQGVTMVARRYRDLLHLASLLEHQLLHSREWDTNKVLKVTDTLSINYADLFGDDDRYANKTLRLKWEQPGVSVKKFFQSKNVPTWLRSYMPLLYCGGQWIRSVDYQVLVARML